MTRDKLNQIEFQDLKLKLISDRLGDSRIYNKPIVFEVVGLIVADVDSAGKKTSLSKHVTVIYNELMSFMKVT